MLTTQTNMMCHTLSLHLLFSLKVKGRGTSRHIAKKEDTGDWYLFNDEKITKKRGDFAKITTKDNIVTQVTSLYYLKNEESHDEEICGEGTGEVGAGGRPWI